MEYSAFVQLAQGDPRRAAAVTVVDGAQGGQSARIWADPNAGAWQVVETRLQQNGVSG